MGPTLIVRHKPGAQSNGTTTEPLHDKTNKMTCAPSKDSDQPGHPTSLIKVFPVLSMGS